MQRSNGGDWIMGKNRSEKIKNRQNDASIMEEAISLNSTKSTEYAPNMNQISKNKS